MSVFEFTQNNENDPLACLASFSWCCETTVSEHLCGAVQFPTFQSPFPVKSDNSQSNRKQIAPKLQIIISCQGKRSPILYSYFKLCLCFTVFLCILFSHSFGSLSLNHSSCGKSVPAVGTLI